MQSELVALIQVPTTVKAEDGRLRKAIGSGYPIREGLLLTARHVLYHEFMNPAGKRIISWRRSDEDKPYHQVEVGQGDIVFEDSTFDIAIVQCDTSELKLPLMTLAESFPNAHDTWESMGYPRAGVESGERKKTSAGGRFFATDTDYYVQQLVSEGNADEGKLWKGMSGAPVFHCKTSQLAAVLIRTPNTYDKHVDGKSRKTVAEVFEDRLVAVSIPYLLKEGKCDGFRNAVRQPSGAGELLPETKTGDQFKKYLSKKVTRALKSSDSDTHRLCEQLAEELDLDDDVQPRKIAEKLIGQKTSSAIDTLSVATEDCVVAGGMRYRETESVEAIKATAQQVLGWLVLGSIDEKKLESVLPNCMRHDSLFFTLAVKSLTGVEVVMARRFNRQSQFEHQTGPEQKSRHLIAPPKGSLKWDEEESTRLIFLEIWNKVFRNNKREGHYQPKPDDWERLNEELAALRDDSEHYYIPFKASEYKQAELAEYVSDVYHHFLSKLNQMTVIQYGEEGSDTNLFFIKEAALQAAINKFYRRINGEKG